MSFTRPNGRIVLDQKVLCHLEYYRSGRFGAKRAAFEDYPLRALFVLPNIERRNNTAERLLQNKPPTLTKVWLTTSPEVIADPLGAIRITPKDYRDTCPRSSSDGFLLDHGNHDRQLTAYRVDCSSKYISPGA